MDRQIEKFELANQQPISTKEASYYSSTTKFNATSEGCLIGFLKIHGFSTLSELENHIESNISSLRNHKGKKYAQTSEQITRSTLIRNGQIFSVDNNKKWSLIVENLEDFENEQVSIISKYSKKKLEKKKQRGEEEIQYLVFKNLLKLDEVLVNENKESENVSKAIDEKYTKLANNS